MLDPSQVGRTPLLVFADDWGRHPSSCQHLIGRLLDDRRVVWVNTIGTRTPRLDRETMSRAGEKIAQWFSPKRGRETAGGDGSAHPNLTVLNPRMWPSFGSPFARRLNRWLLRRQLVAELAGLPEPPIAIAIPPIVADLVGLLPVRRWVYYRVDDFAEWPGLDGRAMRLMEDQLMRRADQIIAVSETRQSHPRLAGRPVPLLTHGVDLEHWRPGPDGRDEDQPAWLSSLEPPLIVFWGVVDRRMDVSFLKRLAENLNRGTIVLLGPSNNPDPSILSLPRVVARPPVPYGELPEVARTASVLVMPYADLPVTRAMQPLKLKEYLATGKPVVARSLPSNLPWANCLDSADDPEEFALAVEARLEMGLPESQRLARKRLASEGWATKARLFEAWITADGSSPADPDAALPLGAAS